MEKAVDSVRIRIGQKMEAERKRKGIPRKQIAAQMHVSETAIFYWEKGRNPITIDDLQTYCKLIGVDWLELLQDAN